MPVATKTQSVTNTKLALATAALLAASGLALAFLPGSGLGEKCGVNTARYASDRACPGGSTNSIEFTCLGDREKTVHSISGRCANPKEYAKAASAECCELAQDTGECVDEEEGNGTEASGRVTYEVRDFGRIVSRGIAEDKCIGPDVLQEAYCGEDGGLKLEKVYCDNGFVCNDGVCVEAEEEVDTACVDSDSDLGLLNSFFTTGTASGIGWSGEVQSYPDGCADYGEERLLESVCVRIPSDDGLQPPSFEVDQRYGECGSYGATCEEDSGGFGRCVCPAGQEFDGERCAVRIIQLVICPRTQQDWEGVCEPCERLGLRLDEERQCVLVDGEPEAWADQDMDGVPDEHDNCPEQANPNQGVCEENH